MEKPSFHDLPDEDQEAISLVVAELLGGSGTANLQEFADKAGKTPDELWADICKLADVAQCAMPKAVPLE